VVPDFLNRIAVKLLSVGAEAGSNQQASEPWIRPERVPRRIRLDEEQVLLTSREGFLEKPERAILFAKPHQDLCQVDRWNLPLLELHRRLGGLRARWPALAGGGYVTLHQPGEPEILAFARTDPDPRQTVICIANPNARRTAARLLLPLPMLPDGLPLRDLLADRRVTCREGFVRIELEQWDVALLVPEPLAVPGYDFYAGALGS